jgi:hypothetical protein
MPARINKRQQREQEELIALGNQPAAAVDADSEDEPAPIALSAFAAVSSILEQICAEIVTMDPAFHCRR